MERHQLGNVWFAPLDVVYGPMTLVEPDLLFIAATRRDILTTQEVTAAPDLVVEVLSPGTARTDRGRKRALHQERGVREYWIVDADQNRVEIWRPGAMEAEVVRDALRWQPERSVAALSIELSQIFKPV